MSKCYLDGLFVNEDVCTPVKEMYERAMACARTKIGDGKPWFQTPTEIDYGDKLYESVLTRGIYVDQLRTFLCAGWRPEQFLIITTNEMKRNIQSVIERIVDFVGITDESRGLVGKKIAKNRAPHIGSKTATQPPIPEDIEDELRAFYEPYNDQFIHFLKKHNFNVDISQMIIELSGEHGRHPRHAKIENMV
eukprot:m.241632 g.241632  ORF g.241632 m.241632 type:complete len:192 (+) comp24553_c0_seq1:521-1096(+)